jgi:hypothetical protein
MDIILLFKLCFYMGLFFAGIEIGYKIVEVKP